jgi:hypothetical protein
LSESASAVEEKGFCFVPLDDEVEMLSFAAFFASTYEEESFDMRNRSSPSSAIQSCVRRWSFDVFQ